MGNFIINSFIIVAIAFILCKGANSELLNEFCRTRPTLVALDHPRYDIFPYFVMLHRCGGSCGNVKPTERECVPVQYNEVKVQVFSTSTGIPKHVKLRNHTKCGESCVRKPEQCDRRIQIWDERNCRCKCLYNNSEPPNGTCAVGYRWNRGNCECECEKPPETCGLKEWNKKACGCVCKRGLEAECRRNGQYLNNKTCSCENIQLLVQPDTQENPNGNKDSKNKLFIGLLIGESFLLVVLCAVLLHTKCQTRRPKGSATSDYVKSPITRSAESLTFLENTNGKSNAFVTTEVTMVSESGGFVTTTT